MTPAGAGGTQGSRKRCLGGRSRWFVNPPALAVVLSRDYSSLRMEGAVAVGYYGCWLRPPN